MRKTPREILNVSDDERHDWLSTANVDELSEFLRLVKQDSSWALHARDALNVLLARENIKLQTDIRDMTERLQGMTKWIIGLTIFMAVLGVIQAYPIVKMFLSNPQVSMDSQKTESTTKQTTNTNQIEDRKNQILRHK